MPPQIVDFHFSFLLCKHGHDETPPNSIQQLPSQRCRNVSFHSTWYTSQPEVARLTCSMPYFTLSLIIEKWLSGLCKCIYNFSKYWMIECHKGSWPFQILQVRQHSFLPLFIMILLWSILELWFLPSPCWSCLPRVEKDGKGALLHHGVHMSTTQWLSGQGKTCNRSKLPWYVA